MNQRLQGQWRAVMTAVALAACSPGPGGSDKGATPEDSGIEEGPPIPDEVVVLDHARVVDASGVTSDRAVLIVGDLIWDIRPAGGPWPDGATVEDLDGDTVIPGLIDTHVHLFLSGSPWWVGDTLAANLTAQVAWGVLGVADLGAPETVFELRDRIASGAVPGPQIWATGPFLTTVGSHPCETVNDREVCRFVDGDGAAQVAALDRADGIKLALADAAFTPWPTPRLDTADLLDIVSAATAAGQPVFAHVDAPEDVWDAEDAGVSIMAHPVFSGPIDPLSDRPVTSTIGAFSGPRELLSGDLLADDLRWTPEDVVAAWTWSAEHPEAYLADWADESLAWEAAAMGNLEASIAAGRTVLAGSDAGYWFVPHGLGLHRELEGLVEAGMTPLEALTAATLAPAEALGWSDRGLVSAGYRADLLVVEGRPDQDIRDTRQIRAVWLGGRQIDPGALSRDPGDDGICLDDTDCPDPDLGCDGLLHRCMPTCDEPGAALSDCGPESACSTADAWTAEAGVCRPYEPCDLYAQDCTPAYYEEACIPLDIDTNRCWHSGPRQEGEACSWDDLAAHCAPGLLCSSVNHTCYRLCDPTSDDACVGCTLQQVGGEPWFGLCL